jgi:hypothetical protein
MRGKKRDTEQRITVASLYGCGKCGTYHRLNVGDRMFCQHCGSSVPLILCGGTVTPAAAVRPGKRDDNDPKC